MRRSFFIVGIFLFVLLSGSVAGAAIYTETFLGTNRDSTAVSLGEAWRAEASFNLVSAGDQLKVFNALTGGTQQGPPINPSTDASGFVSGAENIISAYLYVTISSTDASWEELKIKASINDGSTTLLPYTLYDLDGSPKYRDLTFDLVGLGLTSYLSDGRYMTLVLAADNESWSWTNDFALDQVKLVVETCPKSVPEPMSLLLLGLGLLGIGVARRKN